MKIIALILAVFVAFPNLGYTLTSNCCTHENVDIIDCTSDTADTKDDPQEDQAPCSSQCDCSCCHATLLILEDLQTKSTFIGDFIKSDALNQGNSFAIGHTGHIWQPPKMN
jgi:hypothetical protein